MCDKISDLKTNKQLNLVGFLDTDLNCEKELIENRARSYLPTSFVVAALPLKRINKSVFERKYNDITLSLQGGTNGVPFGKYGRLLLSILTTHAVVKDNLNSDGSLTVEYKSMSAFLEDLQLPRQRSQSIKEQLELFSSCQFWYKEKIKKNKVQKDLFSEYMDTKNMDDTVNCVIINTGSINFIDAYQRADIESEGGAYLGSVKLSVTLSQKFVTLVKNHAIPIDYTTYKDITSPLGKDIYVWLTYRNNYIKTTEKGLFISRKNLVDQFLSQTDSDRERQSYAYIIEQINEIKRKHYKELNIEILETGGIMLYKSEAVIGAKDLRYIPLLNSTS